MVQPWMRGVLLVGGFYNFAWAIFLYYLPGSFIKWITEGAQQQNNLVVYQSIGVAIIGILMFMSALYPSKFRWLVVAVFLAKLLGSIAAYFLLVETVITKKFIFHILMNDLVWLIPLSFILTTLFRNKNNS